MPKSETSIEAYKRILNEGLLGKRQTEVYQAIYNYPNSTDKEIANKLGLEINVVVPRRNELEALGVVVYNGERKCSITGFKSKIWITTENIPLKER